jgi:phosphoribosylformimino-5-aminoimidazole carboxamide ribotide isomerase
LKIIPVIDILNGVVVHAVRGKRSEYKSLKSKLCKSVNPVDVALVFKANGFRELYVADLDAIMCRGSNLSVIEDIVNETELHLSVDAGIADLQEAKKLNKIKIQRIIIGTEILQNLRFVKEAIEQFGSANIIVSIDLKNGKILSASEEVSAMDILQLIHELQKIRVSQLIILDLARVGSNEGSDFILLKKILYCFTGKVFVGGGIRDLNELLELSKLGVAGVLLATALHSGAISIDSLRHAGLI